MGARQTVTNSLGRSRAYHSAELSGGSPTHERTLDSATIFDEIGQQGSLALPTPSDMLRSGFIFRGVKR